VPDYDRRRLAGIVGIEIRVRAIEGKFKLSQNRSAADRLGVVTRLRASGTDNDAALAALMVAAGASAPRS
jgi:transcriptional regulator